MFRLVIIRFLILSQCLYLCQQLTHNEQCSNILGHILLLYLQYIMYTVNCPKSNPNFCDITWNVEENEILHEIFRAVSRFPRCISYSIAEHTRNTALSFSPEIWIEQFNNEVLRNTKHVSFKVFFESQTVK